MHLFPQPFSFSSPSALTAISRCGCRGRRRCGCGGGALGPVPGEEGGGSALLAPADPHWPRVRDDVPGGRGGPEAAVGHGHSHRVAAHPSVHASINSLGLDWEAIQLAEASSSSGAGSQRPT